MTVKLICGSEKHCDKTSALVVVCGAFLLAWHDVAVPVSLCAHLCKMQSQRGSACPMPTGCHGAASAPRNTYLLPIEYQHEVTPTRLMPT